MNAPLKSPSNPRIGTSRACEACRAAKVKCQPSSRLEICRRCLDSKRECVFKKGPRTRRPRRPKTTASLSQQTLDPVGQQKTFTIDISMPEEDGESSDDGFTALRASHEMHMASLNLDCPSEGDDENANDDGGGIGRESSTYYAKHHHDGQHNRHASHSTAGLASSPQLSSLSSLPFASSHALPTPPGSSISSAWASGRDNHKKPTALASMGVRPRFNLDSATALLAWFQSEMLPHFPAVVLLADSGTGDSTFRESQDASGESTVSVVGMARRCPFVLLAILAAASGCRALPGHRLYDEEFRKILGLKSVAGGERSLELLQGLIIYCAWYPSHLRPKNRQAFQYVRMVADVVHDLELDEDPVVGFDSDFNAAAGGRLEDMRTYLASYCLVSSFTATWGKPSALRFTPYTARCCDALERISPVSGDHVLAWLARLQHMIEENREFHKRHTAAQSAYHLDLMLKGMEAQLGEWESRMASDVASSISVKISLLFARTLLYGAPIVAFPAPRRPTRPVTSALDSPSTSTANADATRLQSIVPCLCSLLDTIIALPGDAFNAFTGREWGTFIVVVILAFRVSFSLGAICPAWDGREARRKIGLDHYLERMNSIKKDKKSGHDSEGRGEGSDLRKPRTMDVLTASQVVFDVVLKKYRKRVERSEKLEREYDQLFPADQQASSGVDLNLGGLPLDFAGMDKSLQGCPMLDGSLDSYFASWEEGFTPTNIAPPADLNVGAQFGVADDAGSNAEQGVGPDLWATMTTNWLQTDIDLGDI
ncbi:hypothetical protein VTK73DRAFT_2756 [Phialemonium thermophilum]|uniref:Zn(2)-C6 fungal-type domain-containing protein n=1 Tax=Phialemonium thermophilum TaxID=223376 RepID=A0ABR3Y2I9_9PEZI